MESPMKNKERTDPDEQTMDTSDSLEQSLQTSEHNSEHESQTEMTTCQANDVDNESNHLNDQETFSNPSAENSRSQSPELDRSSLNMDSEEGQSILGEEKTMEEGYEKYPSFSKDNLADWILHIKDSLSSEHKALKENHFKDYKNLDSFKGLVAQTDEMCREYEEQIMTLCMKIREVREVLNNLQTTIDKKLVEEGLLSWLPEDTRAHPAGRSTLINF